MRPRYLLDVNVPIAVLRKDSPLHSAATAWLGDSLERDAEIIVLAETLAAAVRLLSNARAWQEPTPPEKAVDALSALLTATHARVVGAGSEVWHEFTRMCTTRALTTRMVPDALIASAALAYAATVATFDRGLSEYPGVRTVVLPGGL